MWWQPFTKQQGTLPSWTCILTYLDAHLLQHLCSPHPIVSMLDRLKLSWQMRQDDSIEYISWIERLRCSTGRGKSRSGSLVEAPREAFAETGCDLRGESRGARFPVELQRLNTRLEESLWL